MPIATGRPAKPRLECPAAPAPGFRDVGDFNGCGTLFYVGKRGYDWSSTASGSNVCFIDFNPARPTPQGNVYRGYGLQLRCLQEEGGAAEPRGEASQSPVGAQPSRGEYNSFLSPARAAGAPTFCDATESRQRSQPRGRLPPWLTPAIFWPALAESSARRPPP